MDLYWKKGACHLLSTSFISDAICCFLKEQPFLYTSLFVITDQYVYDVHAKQVIAYFKSLGIIVHTHILLPGEQSKTIENAALCWTQMHQNGLDRHSLVIGFGGGVVTDFAGWIASCFMRGIDLLLIPTTLLGMVDASIGGKTGVNLSGGKNIVGTFYPAKCVLFHLDFLLTLPERDYRAGLAEVIKYGMICDSTLFEFLESHIQQINQRDLKIIELIVEKSCKIKVDVVERDERDHGIRALLNWGHTFAHAIETATHYRTYLHGEAVAIGMNCAAQVSCELGLIAQEVVERQAALCQALGLETQLPDLSINDLLELMKRDKKAMSGAISLIVARGIGNGFKMDAVDPNVIKRALSRVGAYVE